MEIFIQGTVGGRRMTENEAIEVLSDFNKQVSTKADGAYQSTIGEMACKVAIKALEEIQQYRAIGTVEELKQLKGNGAFTGLELAQLAAMQMKVKEYQSIGTVEECREAVEKQKAKKPLNICIAKDGNKTVGTVGRCPCCNSIIDFSMIWCDDCGQQLDWSEKK